MKRMFFLVGLMMFFLISTGCSTETKENEIATNLATPSSTDVMDETTIARAVVEKHFEYLSLKDLQGVNSTVIESRRNIQWEFDKIEYFKALDISEEKDPQTYKLYALAKMDQYDLKSDEIKVFRVNYDYKYKPGQSGAMHEGKGVWWYMVMKNKEKDWLICDWGV